jgi:hypothetical protein
MTVPRLHAEFLARAAESLRQDPRVLGVAVAGSWLARQMDQHSDLDLVVCVADAAYEQVLLERPALAAALGPLLAGFTGEHVGEPRLLICLYGPPLLHVDLKFVRSADLGTRVEDPEVIWERDGAFARGLGLGAARWPQPDLQWIEDRFWVWVHYAAGKLGRGELFETLEFLSFLRQSVLGPLALVSAGHLGRGVRKIEQLAPQHLPALLATLATHEARSCAAATQAAVGMYRTLREALAGPALQRRAGAELHAVAHLAQVCAGLPAGGAFACALRQPRVRFR